jgi:hypothetical protein
MYWYNFINLIDGISECGMLCKARTAHMMHFVFESMRVEGEVAEFGCFTGRTAALLSYITESKVWLYDSFEGLPEKNQKDVTNID